jgi:hypothetical protein
MIPEGEHTVVFEFKPRSLRVGALITGVAIAVLVMGFIVSLRNTPS